MSELPSRSALRAILRNDFPSFVRRCFHTLNPGQTFIDEPSISAIAYQLGRIQRGENRRLIINMPPRSLKSIIASVVFPAYMLGHNARQRFICVSYSADLAAKFQNQFRAILESSWYKDLFPATRIGGGKNTETEIETTEHGSRYATSVFGSLTGFGADFMILDDVQKPGDMSSAAKRATSNSWFSETLVTRLNDKKVGATILATQRVHVDDITATLRGLSDDWFVLSLAAIAQTEEIIPLLGGKVLHRKPGDLLAPVREPQWVLDGLRRDMGTPLFSAQYLQLPVPLLGGMIQRPWIKRYTELPNPPYRPFLFQSWDTASKGGPDNDWSVCTTWMRIDGKDVDHFYLIDVWRRRVDYPTLKTAVLEQARKFNVSEVIIEEAGTAIALLDELKFRGVKLEGIKPDRDKETRMSVASAKIEDGRVFFPERAPWLVALEEELFSFPESKYDDQVDSISQALNYESSLRVWQKLGR